MNNDINDYIPSILNPRTFKKNEEENTLTQNSFMNRSLLSLKKDTSLLSLKRDRDTVSKISQEDRKNSIKIKNKDSFKFIENSQDKKNLANKKKITDHSPNENSRDSTLRKWDSDSIGFSIIEEIFNETKTTNIGKFLPNIKQKIIDSDNKFLNTKNSALFSDLPRNKQSERKDSTILKTFDVDSFDFFDERNESNFFSDNLTFKQNCNGEVDIYKKPSILSVSSCSEPGENKAESSNDTVPYELNEKAVFSVSFGLTNCDKVFVDVTNGNLRNFSVTRNNINDTNIECDFSERSHISLDSVENETMSFHGQDPTKCNAVAVNLAIEKHNLSTEPKSTDQNEDKSTVLNLKTNAIEKLTHVIVQPPNYKLVKRKKLNPNILASKSEICSESCSKNDETFLNKKIKQTLIDSHFKCNVIKTQKNVRRDEDTNRQVKEIEKYDTQEMNKISGVAGLKCEVIGRSSKANKDASKPPRLPLQASSSARQEVKACSEVPRGSSPKFKQDSVRSYSPKRNFESIQFCIPMKSTSNKASTVMKSIPHHKIVAGTHFAVDAFSYGEIPNVKHYFLTHFHSDHYSGLKKSFNKILFCSKITADLCMSRLGVSAKCIHIINEDETIRIEGVEVTAVDANHCPGAIMLVFLLPNGKTMLHTGDFRATPAMESYPVFWNRDIHTIYLDTTYCNPRYNFPTQDQSLEMALTLLRQKKMQLEKAGKKFSSVLIVCGTYTIGKEKFFLGMSRRVGCSVWAGPEKDRVLRTVEGRSFSRAPPHACQLHLVPMKDLTHEKMKNYLDSLNGAFDEVVAFKPSGWENGKKSSVERDSVTIHGIPYSEHSSFSELIRFVKYLQPKQVVPTVDISGGIKAVQKFFPCPLVHKEDIQCQSKLTDFFKTENRQQTSAVT